MRDPNSESICSFVRWKEVGLWQAPQISKSMGLPVWFYKGRGGCLYITFSGGTRAGRGQPGSSKQSSLLQMKVASGRVMG